MGKKKEIKRLKKKLRQLEERVEELEDELEEQHVNILKDKFNSGIRRER